jgi:hypothetical protein
MVTISYGFVNHAKLASQLIAILQQGPGPCVSRRDSSLPGTNTLRVVLPGTPGAPLVPRREIRESLRVSPPAIVERQGGC